MKNYPFFFLSLFFLFGCDIKKRELPDSGIVIVRNKVFNTTSLSTHDPVFQSDFKIIYKDRLAIEEIKTIYISEDTAGIKSTRVAIQGYIFIDAERKKYYCYKNFYDTAKLLKAGHLDSVSVDLGWNFYSPEKIKYEGVPTNISDTIINSINYKRLKIKRYIGERGFISIIYFRCEKKHSIFTFDKLLSEKIGCPLTRVDDLPEIKNESASSAEFDFISDTLTAEELRVFAAWENNAKQNPVREQ